MIKKENLEKTTDKILALIETKKYEQATQAIAELNADLQANKEELEVTLAATRKAAKDSDLMMKFIDKSTKLEANGLSAGTSVREKLKGLNPNVRLGASSFIADRAKEAFGNRRKPTTVTGER